WMDTYALDCMAVSRQDATAEPSTFSGSAVPVIRRGGIQRKAQRLKGSKAQRHKGRKGPKTQRSVTTPGSVRRSACITARSGLRTPGSTRRPSWLRHPFERAADSFVGPAANL